MQADALHRRQRADAGRQLPQPVGVEGEPGERGAGADLGAQQRHFVAAARGEGGGEGDWCLQLSKAKQSKAKHIGYPHLSPTPPPHPPLPQTPHTHPPVQREVVQVHQVGEGRRQLTQVVAVQVESPQGGQADPQLRRNRLQLALAQVEPLEAGQRADAGRQALQLRVEAQVQLLKRGQRAHHRRHLGKQIVAGQQRLQRRQARQRGGQAPQRVLRHPQLAQRTQRA